MCATISLSRTSRIGSGLHEELRARAVKVGRGGEHEQIAFERCKPETAGQDVERGGLAGARGVLRGLGRGILQTRANTGDNFDERLLMWIGGSAHAGITTVCPAAKVGGLAARSMKRL